MRQKLVQWLRDKGYRSDDVGLVPARQVMLLGGNPLPILVSALALEPKILYLIRTEEVRLSTIDALRKALTATTAGAPPMEVKVMPPVGASNREDILDRLETIRNDNQGEDQPLGLNYTGGTKVMAAHALAWWQHRYLREPLKRLDPAAQPTHRCTYLDATLDALIFDGVSEPYPMAGVKVSLETLLNLHGLKILNHTTVEKVPSFTAIETRPVDGKEFEKKLFRIIDNLNDSRQIFNPGELFLDVHINGKNEKKRMEMELDIVAMQGHTPIIFSLTTTADKGNAKGKALEVAIRARQIGGDAAKCIVAWWGDDQHSTDLWNDLSTHWEVPPLFRVLGAKHYQGKSAVTHVSPQGPISETLEEMLESWLLNGN